MKKQKLILLLIISSVTIQAQVFFSEINFANNTWKLELRNKKNITITSVKLRNELSTDTTEVSIACLDSLNKPNGLVVITNDSLSKPINFLRIGDGIRLIINDTIFESHLWDQDCSHQYYGDKVYFDLSYPYDGESLVYLDSLDLHSNNYPSTVSNNANSYSHLSAYFGRSLPTIGKPNVRDSAFALLSGQVFDELGTQIKDTYIRGYACWNTTTGTDSIYIDKEGNFSFYTFPNRDTSSMNCHFSTLNFGIWTYQHQPHIPFILALIDQTVNPGSSTFEFFAAMSIKKVYSNIKLFCIQNSKKNETTIFYELPNGINYTNSKILLQNINGETISKKELISEKGMIEFDNNNLPHGVYLCSLQYKGITYKTIKIIKQ